MRRFQLVVLIMILTLLMGCTTESEKGDYIIGKDKSYANNTTAYTILVAKNISEKELKSKSLSELRAKGIELMYYHIEDYLLYDDLSIGEKVSMETKVVSTDGMDISVINQSNPPQAIAGEIIRYSK